MKRREGFKVFNRKVRGDDTILEEEGAGGWVYTEYDFLYRLGTCQISWSEYLQGFNNLGVEERQDHFTERSRLGIRLGFNCEVGRDQPMRIRLKQASEPQSRDQSSEQQSINTFAVTIRGLVSNYGYEHESARTTICFDGEDYPIITRTGNICRIYVGGVYRALRITPDNA